VSPGTLSPPGGKPAPLVLDRTGANPSAATQMQLRGRLAHGQARRRVPALRRDGRRRRRWEAETAPELAHGRRGCPEVCQLRRVPAGRRPPKRRRFREIPSSPGSSASLLRGRAGRSDCSPAHPVSPAGNPVQTHTEPPSGPVRIPEPISTRTPNQIQRCYTRLKAMLRDYDSAEFHRCWLITRRDIPSQIGRRSTL
jgi:hypothetical protein